MSANATLAVRTASVLDRVRKHNPTLANLIESVGIDAAKASNPDHTTPNLAVVLLAVKAAIAANGSYSGGNSNTDLGRNYVVTKENGKESRKVLSPTADPIVKAHGKNNTGVPSFFSAICNAIQVPGMKNGPENVFLQYISAFTTDFGGTVPVELLVELADADAKIRAAFKAANAAK